MQALDWQYRQRNRAATLVAFLCLLSACVTLAPYDQRAYENATSLKAKTLAMMAKSGEEDSYARHAEAVDALQVRLSAAYEYANGVLHNNEAAKNWRDLIGDDETMIGGWLAAWKHDGGVSGALLDELRIQVAEGFDTIICLEANKRQVTACPSLKTAD